MHTFADAGCLWGNMPFSKQLAFVLLARALGVTHIVESGRMGGISLLHYRRLGFRNLTSVELSPAIAPKVAEALRAAVPGIALLDGDGAQLVPQAVAAILRAEPAARVACILDGPKGAAAVRLARQLAASTALLALDDQAYGGAWGWGGGLRFFSNSTLWRAALPIEREGALVEPWARSLYAAPPRVDPAPLSPRAPSPIHPRSTGCPPACPFSPKDVSTLLLGDRSLLWGLHAPEVAPLRQQQGDIFRGEATGGAVYGAGPPARCTVQSRQAWLVVVGLDPLQYTCAAALLGRALDRQATQRRRIAVVHHAPADAGTAVALRLLNESGWSTLLRPTAPEASGFRAWDSTGSMSVERGTPGRARLLTAKLVEAHRLAEGDRCLDAVVVLDLDVLPLRPSEAGADADALFASVAGGRADLAAFRSDFGRADPQSYAQREDAPCRTARGVSIGGVQTGLMVVRPSAHVARRLPALFGRLGARQLDFEQSVEGVDGSESGVAFEHARKPRPRPLPPRPAEAAALRCAAAAKAF